MHLFELTRALVDTESITGNEERIGLQLLDYVSALAERYGGHAERSEVEPGRSNVLAFWGDRPAVTLSTHMDTVPPFVASREDAEFIWGRGACDTKGIIACMIKAAEALLEIDSDSRSGGPAPRGTRSFGGTALIPSLGVGDGIGEITSRKRHSQTIIMRDTTRADFCVTSRLGVVVMSRSRFQLIWTALYRLSATLWIAGLAAR